MKKKSLIRVLTFGIFLFTFQMQAQKKSDLKGITKNYNQKKLSDLESSLRKEAAEKKENLIKLAKQNGWKTRLTNKKGATLEIQNVVDGKPIYYTTFNDAAAKSTRANHLNTGGSLRLNLMGQNMIAHVWDAGVSRATHQEYDGPGGSNRASSGDGTNTLNFHAAHVTGTIMASGVVARAKGMAPHARVRNYDWNSDASEAANAAASGMLLSNHSYGYVAGSIPDAWFGQYSNESRNWDNIMFNAPNFLQVSAAGNDGNDNGSNAAPLDGNSSYDKLSGFSTSKNGLVVAAANDANVNANGDLVSVSIANFSSEGPTDDYRIKPDITGNGVSLYSTYEGSDNAYNSISGTSMASPNVTGTLLLLQQHAKNVRGSFIKASTLKGLALHTADDAGQNGPDAIFGWGLLNAKSAAEAITKNGKESKIEELNLTNGQKYQITVDADGINDLKASISWTDRPGGATTAQNSKIPVLVNDLDIRVTKNGTSYNPWKLTGVASNGKGDNNVDPYERVDVANASGTYTITVTHKGNLTGGNQNFSLIVTGVKGGGSSSYCSSKSSNTYYMHIKNVTVAGINNTTGRSSGGYADYTSKIGNVSKRGVNQFRITPNFRSGRYGVGYAIFVDFNHDNDFDDAGETVWTKDYSIDLVVGGSFKVPTSAKSGKTRMRVVMEYAATPSACGTYNYGETEDYTLNISGSSAGPDTEAPKIPTNLVATSITTTTATLNWQASSDNVGVKEYEVSFGGSIVAITPNTTTVITGLISGGTYSCSVRAKDAAGNVSKLSNKLIFTTKKQINYCDSKGVYDNYMWIDHIYFNGIDNYSNKNGGYKDFTSKTATINIGSSSTLYFKPGYSGYNYTLSWMVWIDFNQNGIFEDGERQVDGLSNTSGWLYDNISIPTSAKTGLTRMRVSMKYASSQTACETFTFGEVEDYSVNIVNAGAFGYVTYEKTDITAEKLGNIAPTSVSVFPNPARNNVNISIPGNDGELSYKILNVIGQVVKVGKTSGKEVNISSLESGIYILETFDGQITFTTKLIKE